MTTTEHYRRLELIVQHTTNMVVVTNAQREIEWVNPAYTQITGWTLEEVKGRNPKSFLHGPKTNRELARHLGDRLRQGLPVQDYEMINYTKDGRPYWVSLSIQPILDHMGRVAEYVAIQSDITERKQREAETAKVYKRLAEAQRIAGLGYMEHDLTTGLVHCSPEIFRIIDAEPTTPPPPYEELMACAHPDDRADVQACYERAVNGRLPYVSEHRVLTKTGRVKWVHMRGVLEGWDDGTPALCRMVVQDVTERKRAEQMAEERARLEQMAQVQMEVLARISHELRTPLNAVMGLTDMVERVEEEHMAPESRKHMELIRQASRHLLDIVNDVTDLTRIHDRRLELQAEPLDLQALVVDVVEMLRPLADGKLQSLHATLEATSRLCVLGDRQRLRQVLINLVGNALKFTPAGGHVSVRCAQAAKGWVQLEVADDGIGIEARHLRRLFDPFYQVQLPAAGQPAPGSGLGLAISRELARSMGGDISVVSQPGKGSTFKLLLPGLQEPGASTPAPVARSDAAVGQRVLVIEDSEVSRLLVTHFVADRPDLRVECCATGRAGLEAARRSPPDLMVVDMHLPDMSGHDVMREVLNDPRLFRTPCLAFSADGSEAAVVLAISSGFRDYLSKPISATEFLQAVDRLLQPSLDPISRAP